MESSSEFNRLRLPTSIVAKVRICTWLNLGKRCPASEAIVRKLFSKDMDIHLSIPDDEMFPSPKNRDDEHSCLELIYVVPEIMDRLDEMSTVGADWEAAVRRLKAQYDGPLKSDVEERLRCALNRLNGGGHAYTEI